MKVNFMGIINGISTFMPKMLEENKGHIIAVTSSVARLPLPRAEAYGASKAAATYMIDSLRIALSETNIKLTTVMPGFVETPMTGQNDFPMPFIIKPEVAADRIMKGIVKGKKDIFFPNRFTWPLRLIASLPTSLAYQFTKKAQTLNKKKIAIIGSGISGLTCGYYLNDEYDIKMFEAGNYIGGHTNTIKVDSDDGPLNIDTGFIVFNDWTYPNFIKMLDENWR